MKNKLSKTEITNLFKPVVNWALSMCSIYFWDSFTKSPQYKNFLNTGKLKLTLYGKTFYFVDYMCIMKVEKIGPMNCKKKIGAKERFISEVLLKDGKIYGTFIKTDLPEMNMF